MLESISPYALLRASIPKKTPVIVTAYDLYSAAQSEAPAPQEAPVPAPIAETAPTPAPARPSTIPRKKTHYISDIKTRHCAAAGRAGYGMPCRM